MLRHLLPLLLIACAAPDRRDDIIRNHDVEDLVSEDAVPYQMRRGGLRLISPDEDPSPRPRPWRITIENLEQLIRENVAPGTWDDPGVSIECGEGFILMVHSAEVQAEVRDFLDHLRLFNDWRPIGWR